MAPPRWRAGPAPSLRAGCSRTPIAASRQAGDLIGAISDVAGEHLRERATDQGLDAHGLGVAGCREPALHRAVAAGRDDLPVRLAVARDRAADSDPPAAPAGALGPGRIRLHGGQRHAVPACLSGSLYL